MIRVMSVKSCQFCNRVLYMSQKATANIIPKGVDAEALVKTLTSDNFKPYLVSGHEREEGHEGQAQPGASMYVHFRKCAVLICICLALKNASKLLFCVCRTSSTQCSPMLSHAAFQHTVLFHVGTQGLNFCFGAGSRCHHGNHYPNVVHFLEWLEWLCHHHSRRFAEGIEYQDV